MEPAVERDGQRGLTLLDVLVALALLALFVWLLKMDWVGHRRLREEPAPTAIAAPLT
jgi:Tfp pilus assembly protein FimT